MSEPRTPGNLSSDILEAQFGPTALKVIEDGPGRRIISTVADGRVLEVSMVVFRRGAEAAFPEVRRDMADGVSMGKAFRGRGIPFRRQVRGTYAVEPQGSLCQRFGAGGKATAVEVSVAAGPEARPYADILEVYAPAVDWPDPGTAPPKDVLARLNDFDRLLTDLKD